MQAALYFSSKKTMEDAVFSEKIALSQQIEMIQIELKNKERELIQVEEVVSKYRSDLRIIKSNMVQYYLTVLSEGTDTRGEGLHYLVKILLSLGVELKISMFPRALDEVSVNVLIKLAEKSIELEGLMDSLAVSKRVKGKVGTSRINIHQRLAELTRTIRTLRPDHSRKKTVWRFSDAHGNEIEAEEAEKNENAGHSETEVLEEKVNEVKREILEIQVAEIKRLTRDCVNSGRSLKEVANWIVGRDNFEKFLIHSNKQIKDMMQTKERTTTFSFVSKMQTIKKLQSSHN